jgi:hypothetical protein
MYNGVGLQTARGSGTSGYVQKNLSYIGPGAKPKLQNYGLILKQMKENPNPLPKPPNPELVMHERKRKIEAQLFTMAKRLKLEGKNQDEINKLIAAERVRLTQEIDGKQASVSDKD